MTEPRLDWWARAIGDFGASLGFKDTGHWNSDALNLCVNGGQYLVDVERSRDEILLAVFRQVPPHEVATKIWFLLRACNFDSGQPFFLQAGLKHEDVIVLAARLDRSEAHSMYSAFELIRKLYAAARL